MRDFTVRSAYHNTSKLPLSLLNYSFYKKKLFSLCFLIRSAIIFVYIVTPFLRIGVTVIFNTREVGVTLSVSIH